MLGSALTKKVHVPGFFRRIGLPGRTTCPRESLVAWVPHAFLQVFSGALLGSRTLPFYRARVGALTPEQTHEHTGERRLGDNCPGQLGDN